MSEKKPVAGIHHVAFKIKNFDEVVDFYTRVLGFQRALSWKNGDGLRCLMLDTGSGILELFETGDTPGPAAGAYEHFALRTPSCDEAAALVKQAGMTFTVEPCDVTIAGEPPKPVRIAFFTGPFGETVELFEEK